MATTHGMCGSLEHTTWKGVLRRCLNRNDHNFQKYGAKGITVCDRWLSFQNFFDDMGFRPTPKHTIERIDNSKGYFKENCRWATKAEQNLNYRRNMKVLYNGETTPLSVLLKRLNVPYYPASYLAKKNRLHEVVPGAVVISRWSTKQRKTIYMAVTE